MGMLVSYQCQCISDTQFVILYSVMVDVWWGLTEPSPRNYNFTGYVILHHFVAKEANLRSTQRRCSGNHVPPA